jgi:hypothetical protein
MKKREVGLLLLSGILFGGAAFLAERQGKTQSELQKAEGEFESLRSNTQMGQIVLARMADSLSPGDSAYDSIVELLAHDQAAAEQLSALTIPNLQSKLRWERIAMRVSGICGGLFLVLFYLQRARQSNRRTE